MKKIIFFIAFLNCLITLGQSEFSSNSNGSKLSDATLSQIKQRLKDFEVVDFDHKSLDKFLKASNKQAKIKLGKNISGTWDFEENELRASYVGKSKYDSDGNLLNGVELAETYMAKSEKNPNANIRLLVSSSLIAGFIHDGDAFIRIESLAYFLNSQKPEYDGKIIIYDDRNAVITNDIKCGVNAKQSTVSSMATQSARIAQDYCKRLLSIAVETDANFPANTINSVMQEVDYILYLNFGLKVEFYHKSWSGQSVNPYSSTYVPYITAGNPGAGRIEESIIFSRFQNAGWVVNNLPGYDMYHLITGRNMYASGNGNTGGYALSIPICGSQKPISISSTEFSGVQQIARTMCHELGHNLSGNPNHDTNCTSCQNTTPSNTMMCTFISGVGGCRGMYFSSTSRTQIENNLLNNSCLSQTPVPIINQVYFNGTPVGTNLNFVSNRAGQMSVNVSDTYPFPSTIVNWIPTVNSVNVYGNPGKSISYFVPNNVSSYVMQVKAENRCGTVYRNIPFLYGSGFKVYPNPASRTTFVEFDLDPTYSKNDVFLPHTITLKSEKNEILKKSNPKQDLIDKRLEDGKRVKWDVSTLPDGIYYIDVIYSDNNTSTVRLLIQK